MKDTLRCTLPNLHRLAQRGGGIIWRALVKYDETDGEQRAASFAYYAFFSLFPLILLLIAAGTTLLGSQERAAREIIGYVGNFIPIQATEANVVIDTINGVVRSR